MRSRFVIWIKYIVIVTNISTLLNLFTVALDVGTYLFDSKGRATGQSESVVFTKIIRDLEQSCQSIVEFFMYV